MATTPPPPPAVTEPPPTPLFGAKLDAGVADGTRRAKKQKVAAAQIAARTPSPVCRTRASASSSPSLRRSSRLRPSADVQSPPSSPLSPSRSRPRAKPQPSDAGHKRAGAESEARKHKGQGEDHLSASSSLLVPAMLPTPTKTPRKKDAAKKSPSVTRILFPHGPQAVEDAMPKPHGKRDAARRHAEALSLESFAANGSGAADIEIFTDTRDTIPELDASADNPFYSPNRPGPKSKRKSPRNNGTDAGVQKVLEADAGMVYVL